MSKKKVVNEPITINPVTKLPGRMYTYDGVEYQEEFKYTVIAGNYYLVSSLGELWISTELGFSKLTYGSSKGCRVYTLHDKQTNKRLCVRIHRVIGELWIPKTEEDEQQKRDLLMVRVEGDRCPQNMMWVNYTEMNRYLRWKKNPTYDNKVIVDFFSDKSFNYVPSRVRDVLGIKDSDAIRMLANIKKRVRRHMK